MDNNVAIKRSKLCLKTKKSANGSAANIIRENTSPQFNNLKNEQLSKKNVTSSSVNVSTQEKKAQNERPPIKWEPLPELDTMLHKDCKDEVKQTKKRISKELCNSKEWRPLPKPCIKCVHIILSQKLFLDFNDPLPNSKKSLNETTNNENANEISARNFNDISKNETHNYPCSSNKLLSTDFFSGQLENPTKIPKVYLFTKNEQKVEKNANASFIKEKDQCPICMKQFEPESNLMEKDGHIAQCLSGAADDIVW